MSNVTLPLDEKRRPIIKVAVGLSAPRLRILAEAGLPAAYPEVSSALIDTGSDLTIIDRTVAARIDPEEVGETEVRGVATGDEPVVCALYEVGIWFLQPAAAPIREVVAVAVMNLSALGVGVVIGRDILSRCVFIYNGPDSRFTLAV